MSAFNPLGVVKREGETTRTGTPHICAYAVEGSGKDRCLALTTNYNRNRDGCCGTKDFEPCNFQWRKCVQCVASGRGLQANAVAEADVATGLCEEHKRRAAAPVPPMAPIEPKRIVRTVVLPPGHKNLEKPVRTAAKEGERQKAVQTVAPHNTAMLASMRQKIRAGFSMVRAVELFNKFTPEKKETARTLLRGERPSQLKASSVASYKSGLCNAIGIPKMHRHGGTGVRMELLQQVVDRYDELQRMDPNHRALHKLPNADIVTDQWELELIAYSRLLSEEERKQLLDEVKARVEAKRTGG